MADESERENNAIRCMFLVSFCFSCNKPMSTQKQGKQIYNQKSTRKGSEEEEKEFDIFFQPQLLEHTFERVIFISVLQVWYKVAPMENRRGRKTELQETKIVQ